LTVGAGIIRALAAGEFLLFPDKMAQQLGAAYDAFRAQIIESEMAVA